MKRMLLLALAALMLVSCAHVISPDARKDATVDVPFAEVSGDPGKYEGKTFVWGGAIVRTKLTDTGSLMEVVQNPVNSQGYIKDPDITEGRFLVRSKKQVDPLIYKRGRFVTVAGVLRGSRTLKHGDTSYRYPVLEASEVYLWQEEAEYPYGYYDHYPTYYPYRWRPRHSPCYGRWRFDPRCP